jgi:hypothetical protein
MQDYDKLNLLTTIDACISTNDMVRHNASKGYVDLQNACSVDKLLIILRNQVVSMQTR